MKIKVLCLYVVEVEVPDDPEYDAPFDIEENHCPGTGLVGVALEEQIHRCDKKGVCWACPHGSNIILTEERAAVLAKRFTSQRDVLSILFPDE